MLRGVVVFRKHFKFCRLANVGDKLRAGPARTLRKQGA
jgi:hypothetical protein